MLFGGASIDLGTLGPPPRECRVFYTASSNSLQAGFVLNAIGELVIINTEVPILDHHP
jgi:hypothetical protein